MAKFVVVRQEEWEAPAYFFVEMESPEVLRALIAKEILAAVTPGVGFNSNTICIKGTMTLWIGDVVAEEILAALPYVAEKRQQFSAADISLPIYPLDEWLARQRSFTLP